MSNLTECLDGFDELRRVRQESLNLDEAEEPILDKMDALWALLSEEERAKVRSEAWRAWPEDFAKRMANVRTGLVDRPVWGKPNTGPRQSG